MFEPTRVKLNSREEGNPRLRASRSLAVLMVCLAVLVSGCVTDISVSRHPSVSLSNTQAQQILAEFTSVISVSDSPSDIACATDAIGQLLPAIYLLDGTVSSYSGPGVINSEADYTAVLTEPGYVKVVSAINWCGDFGPNIAGCAPIPGSSFAVVRLSGTLEGILWAHEFGHTVGLEHRNENRAVMRSSIASNARGINLAECERFVEKFNPAYYAQGAASAARTADVNPPPAVDGFSASTVPEGTSLMELVRAVYPHGTPMKALAEFDTTGDLPALRAMLLDDTESLFWGNAVVALGMLGDASDVPRLVQFAAAQAALPDEAGLMNASAALMALGYLANRTGDATALAYLANQMDPESWTQTQPMRQQLAITAHIGMAFAGQMAPATSARAARSHSVLPPALASELGQVSAEMASRGVRDYYKSR